MQEISIRSPLLVRSNPPKMLAITIRPGRTRESKSDRREKPSGIQGMIRFKRKEAVMKKVATLILLAGCVILAGASHAIAQGNSPGLAQVVALDECDPTTFNAALGPDFCKNVTLGAFTTLSDLLAAAEAGTPDPGWDFEPDTLAIKKGTIVSVVDQGGEPHTFTEVKAFGNGFIPLLNPGSATSVIPECAGGFSKVAVAKTRILQGSHLDITGLSKGKHLFQCCIHPWMRMEVDVK
jgi:plastocyanin